MDIPKANPENLLEIVKDAYRAKVVVPEFQRSFVWSRENIEEFLASIIQGYFVGTFLMLDTTPEHPMFPFRVVEGLETVNGQVNPGNIQPYASSSTGNSGLPRSFMRCMPRIFLCDTASIRTDFTCAWSLYWKGIPMKRS